MNGNVASMELPNDPANRLAAWPGHARSHVRLCIAIYTNEELLLRPRVPCICHLLPKLSDRHRDILSARFGIDRYDPLMEYDVPTLSAVADAFGISRQALRQSELLALKKLRQIWEATVLIREAAA